jgi:HprK-related kinase A
LNIASLSRGEIAVHLRGSGLHLRTGPFTLSLQCNVPRMADPIALLYADYPLISDDEFVDFRVKVNAPRGIRRWIRPQITFAFDGTMPFAPLPGDQFFPMLEWGLNWCVSSHAHGFLIIHSAVVEKNGFAAILPAPPGSGKSTLCAALINRGWRLLSDELALIRLSDGMIVPIPRPVSLKNASINIIKHYEPSTVFSRKVRDTIKGTVAHMRPPAESIWRAEEVAMPAWIIFPKYEAGVATSLVPMTPASGFMRVAENCFNYNLLGQSGFDNLAGLMDRCQSFDFSYSVIDEAIETFAGLATKRAEV